MTVAATFGFQVTFLNSFFNIPGLLYCTNLHEPLHPSEVPMRRSTARCLMIVGSLTLGIGACGFTPHPQTTGGNTGAANSTGTVTGTGNSTGAAASSGGGGTNGGTSNPDSNCGAVSRGAAKVPPDVLIVFDASGSMNDDLTNTMCTGGCGATSKWAQAVAPVNMVVADTQANVNWGLKMFADDANCTVGNGANVAVGTNTAGAIMTALAGRTSANGGVANGSRTPTRAGVSQGAAYLRGLNDMAPKYIVLATDGLPNCPANGNTGNDDSTAAIAAVMASATSGIPVFVIGVATAGTGTADTTLTAMANAGGLARAGTPAYYPVTSGADLSAALNTLVGVVASCTFAIGTPPNSNTSTDYIDVFANGVEIPQDTTHTNGWDYTGRHAHLRPDLRTDLRRASWRARSRTSP